MNQENLPQLPQPEDQAVLPGGEASGALPEGGTQLPIDPEVAKGVGQRVVASETDGSVPASQIMANKPSVSPAAREVIGDNPYLPDGTQPKV